MEETDRQLPSGEEIFLDHLGHFVRDRAAAADALARLGFAPTPESVQVVPTPDGGTTPTGTGNVTAMFARGYLEILFKTADTPLGQQHDAALARYAGVHLAAFSVREAGEAHARLAAAGFAMQPLVSMQRPVGTAEGEGIAAFTVARVVPGTMAEGRIQIVTHRTEHTVWQPRWLDHRNGAVALADVTIAVADPVEAAARFSRFVDRPAETTPWGATVALDRGRIVITSAEGFSSLVPGVTIPSLPFIGAYGISVRSRAVLERCLREAGTPFTIDGEAVIAPFPEALGAGAVVFAETPAMLPWRR